MNKLDFEIFPYTGTVDIASAKGFSKLDLSKSQQAQVEAFIQQIPSLTGATALANAYTVSFPEGIYGELMKYSAGGVGTPIIGENGKIVGHASLHSLAPQALAMGCFSAMSIATSQHYLKEINDELRLIRLGLDKILEFLYGDKKAELVAEIGFVQYAHRNYASIMEHEHQRSAVISSLLDAKKVAIKDIEFYLSDLDSLITTKEKQDIGEVIKKVFQIKDSLELAMQLYGISSLLEVYYAQNYDADYIRYVEHSFSTYISKCEKQVLSSFSALRKAVENAKALPLKKMPNKDIVLKDIDAVIEILKQGEDSDMRKSLSSVFRTTTRRAEYYIGTDGVVYLKAS